METINSQEVYAYKSELKLGKLVSLMNICKALGLFGLQLLVTEIFSFIPPFCPIFTFHLNSSFLLLSRSDAIASVKKLRNLSCFEEPKVCLFIKVFFPSTCELSDL